MAQLTSLTKEVKQYTEANAITLTEIRVYLFQDEAHEELSEGWNQKAVLVFQHSARYYISIKHYTDKDLALNPLVAEQQKQLTIHLNELFHTRLNSFIHKE